MFSLEETVPGSVSRDRPECAGGRPLSGRTQALWAYGVGTACQTWPNSASGRARAHPAEHVAGTQRPR